MRRRFLKPVWFLLALLFAGQSLLPVAALAQVSVRCVGAPMSSAPCAQGMFVATDTAAISDRFATLICCRTMTRCPMLAAQGCGQMSLTATAVSSLSAPKCLVSVSLLNTKPATLGPQTSQWLLQSAQALAPPVVRPFPIVSSLPSAVTLAITSFDLPAPVSTQSHGLRAPPVS